MSDDYVRSIDDDGHVFYERADEVEAVRVQPYQVRLISEARELAGRLRKLNIFIDEIFELPPNERALMLRQQELMSELCDVLWRRLGMSFAASQ